MGRRATRLSLIVVLVVASTWFARGPNAAPTGQSPLTTMTGVVSVRWHDPDPASGLRPTEDYLFTDDVLGVFRLEIDPVFGESVGGLAFLHRKRVTLTGFQVAAPAGVNHRMFRVTGLVVEPPPPPPPPSNDPKPDSVPSTGSRPYITILCKYNDIGAEPAPFDYFQAFSNARPWMNHYWQELSYGAVNVLGSATVGWFTLPHPKAYYFPGGAFDEDLLADECTTAADASVVFPNFAGINMVVNNQIDLSGGFVGLGGAITLTRDSVTREYGATWLASNANIGSLAHEMGHAFGLPHSSGNYGLVYDNAWDVMSEADREQHTIAYHKDQLGWLAGKRLDVAIGSNPTVLVNQLSTSSLGWQMLKVPIAGTLRFYTVEARTLVGYDDSLPGNAIIIHEVDPARPEPAHVIDIDGNGDTSDAGAQWTAGETFTDAPNGITITVNSFASGSFSVTVNVVQSNLPPPVIQSHPVDRRVVQFATTSFTSTATGATLLQWQESTDGGANWITLTNTSPFSGVTTTTLTVNFPFASLDGHRYRLLATNAGGSTPSNSALLQVLSSGTNALTNGNFSNGLNNWTAFATPDNNYISAAIVGGVLQYSRVPPPPGQSNQAVMLQGANLPLPADTFISASMSLGNSSPVRKRISVLIHDGDFSDLSVCTLFIGPNAPLTQFTMQTHVTKAWGNATISLYAASDDTGGGKYLVDDVSLTATWVGGPVPDTTCLWPSPSSQALPDGVEMLTNGNFSNGTAGWTLFGQIGSQVTGGVFEFIKQGSAPSGVILQNTLQAVPSADRLTAHFQMGNSSGVRKRVTILVHDGDFTDLVACTYWLDPGAPLADYEIRTVLFKAWTNATLSVYPATTDNLGWVRLDNVSFKRTPSKAVFGTYCLEPGTSR